jgi:subtilisin family serine protease
MKLKCGKGYNDHVVLRHMPIEARVEKGAKIFEAKRSDATKAAYLANKVVTRTFMKTFSSEADRAIRVDIGAGRVKVAVYQDDVGRHRVVYREAIVRFEDDCSKARQKKLLAKYKLRIREVDEYDPLQVIVYDPRRKYIAETMLDLTNELTDTEEVKFAFPNFVSEFRRAAAPAVHRGQWHIGEVKAPKAWETTRGEGITIAILDDGVDVDHPNLRDNIRKNPGGTDRHDTCGRDMFIDASKDPDDKFETYDPRPKIFRFPFNDSDTNDNHGTSCAGVAAASGRVGKVFGIAPRARLLPVKIFHGDAPLVEKQVAKAIRYAARHADILSCSWDGPRGPHMEAALESAAHGRGGKGCPIFVASGNENRKVGYPAHSQQCIAVGASTDQGKRAPYSNYGRSLWVLAPSNGGKRDIFTTDVSYRHRGYNAGLASHGDAKGIFCNDFGGTSSATPLVAGVAALMLSANPNLTREEVKEILQDTTDKIGPKRAYKKNGHSTSYGYGQVNAARAVARAKKLAAAGRKAARKSR